ncbi:MAG TPA: serine hydrolase [Burkholderiaceae bacterium]|nr:serine hydrolase [Burkholderiaceae bacterium]
MRSIVTLVIGSCMLVASAGMHEANAAASSNSQAAKTITKAKAQARVRGTIPAGRTPIKSTRKKSLIARILAPSEGHLAGLHRGDDPLDLRSSVALVVDQDTNEVLFEKNKHAVLPIASVTKLMTALVTLDSNLPLAEELQVSQDELVRARIRSNLRPGFEMTRGTALHLALMSSENRAAQLLGRTYPGGLSRFVEAMNAKARLLGMNDTHFADPTGLSPENRSSASDLVRLVKAAYEHDVIREYSVSGELALPVGNRTVSYRNTNRLTDNPEWDIGLQKTGYISAAGRCLVMQAVIEGKRVVMVFLDSVGKYSRLGDAQRIRDFLEAPRASKLSKPAVDSSRRAM